MRAGGQDHHLIRIFQLVHGERRNAGRHAELFAQREEMLARNARQDEIIRRRSAEHAVLENRQTGMRTLSYAVAAVEHNLVAACLNGLLHGHAVRDQVERFDVAVQKARVLDRNQLVRMILAVQSARLSKRHQAGLAVRRKRMLAVRHGSGRLPVQHVRRIRIQLHDQTVQRFRQLVTLHRRLNAEQLQAVVKTVEMVIECENLLVIHHRRVINAVAEVKAAVGDGRLHLVDAADFSVIVCNILHGNMPPLMKIPSQSNLSITVFDRVCKWTGNAV